LNFIASSPSKRCPVTGATGLELPHAFQLP
jgi:hypothetical protein